MARIGADTGTDAGTEDTTDTTSDDDAGADTSVEDRTRDIIDTGEQDTNITAPEPDQPARGGGSTDTGGDAGADTSAEQKADQIQQTGDQDTNATTPDPYQPARGGQETDSTPAVADPEPEQPARGRGDEGSGPSSQTGGFGYIDADDETAADLNRRISRVRGNLRQRQQEARDQQVSQQMDRGVGLANRRLSRQRGNFRQASQEQFGDADVSFGTNALTDEEAQREASEEYQQAVESATGEGGIFGESLIAEGLEYAGYDQTAETVEETGRDFLGGVGAILNPAAVAVTATETAEYGIYGAQQYAEGDFEDFVGESQEAGVNRARAFADYIGENPAEAVGMGAGALVGSAAVMSAAGRISPRAGMATRYAIQPGEEIAGSAGFRATRAIGGEASAQRYFPNREPLIFSEEAAIRGLRGASSRVRNVRNIDTELAGSPRQRDIVERFRPTGGTGEFESGIATESQVAGAQSEPLGSRGDEVLNRLYGGGKTQTTTTTSPEPRRGVSELLASERGQAQIGRQIGRTETESEVRLTDDRVSDNLYQQAVSRQVQAEYGARQGTIDDPDFRYETQRRTERAQESEVRTEAETDVTRPRMRLETFINERADTEPFEIEGVDTDVGQDTGFDALSEFETEFEQEAEQETETELESLFETEFKQEAEQETETELESLFETEFETEFEQETEQELELETETEAETRREVFGLPDFESGGGDDIAGLFAADRGERVTDFIDPLTGERLE